MRIKIASFVAVVLALAAVSSAAPVPVARAIVGTAPAAVAYNPVTHLWYVANSSTSDVSILAGAGAQLGVSGGPGQTGAFQELARVAVGKSPQGIAISPSSGLVFVSSYDTDSVGVLAGPSSPIATVAVGDKPWGLAVDASLGRVCVANFGSNDVTIFDASSRAVLATVKVHLGPTSVTAGNGKCWVTNFFDGTVQGIDLATNTVTFTAPAVPGRTDSYPRGIALSADGLTLFVANSADSSLTLLNPITGALLGRIALDPGSAPIGVAASARTVYVTESALARVAFVNPASRAFVTRPAGANPVAVGVGTMPECAAVADLSSASASLFCDNS